MVARVATGMLLLVVVTLLVVLLVMVAVFVLIGTSCALMLKFSSRVEGGGLALSDSSSFVRTISSTFVID